MTQQQMDALTDGYRVVLDDLRSRLEDRLGPLVWDDPGPARLVHLVEGDEVVRLGPISGFGVILPQVEPAALQAEIEPILAAHGFEVRQDLVGSASGHLLLKAVDADGVRLTFRCRESAEAWIDQRAR